MTQPLVTQREYEALVRRLMLLEQRVGRVEVRERGDYSFGSFAPTLVGAGTAGTFTYATGNLIEWTVEGNSLFFNGRVNISATSVAPVGNLMINGWPFPGVADTNMTIAGVGSIEWRSVNLPANYWAIALQFSNGSSSGFLVRSGTNNNFAIVQGGELAGGVYDFRIGGQYRIV